MQYSNDFTCEGFLEAMTQYFPDEDIRLCKDAYDAMARFLADNRLEPCNESAALWMDSKALPDIVDGQCLRENGAKLLVGEYIEFGTLGRTSKVPAFSKRFGLEFYCLLAMFRRQDVDVSDSWRCERFKRCAEILRLFEQSGAKSLSGMTLAAVADVFEKTGKAGSAIAKSRIRMVYEDFLEFLHGLGAIPYSHVLLAREMRLSLSGCTWLCRDARIPEGLAGTAAGGDSLTLEGLLECRDALGPRFMDAGLGRGRHEFSKDVTHLYLFLEYHGIAFYSRKAGEAWLDAMQAGKPLHPRALNGYRRTLYFLNEAACGREASVCRQRKRDRMVDGLPDWCRGTAKAFIARKEKAGLAASTVGLFQSSACRLLLYLDRNGVRSFRDVTAGLLHQFVLDDRHGTPEGKNAFLSRARDFLRYLEETGQVDKAGLDMALPHVCAARVKNVVVLTKDQEDRLAQACAPGCDAVSRRDKAILLLGHDMGLRRVDVVGLCIEDIDWDRQAIRILQHKTRHEIELAMPARVGNALYRYIMDERPESHDRHVLLATNKPCRPLSPHACEKAVRMVFPDGDVKGFHVLRRTHASNALNNGATVGEVAAELGHRDFSNVHKYLSLDERRMRECAVSLKEYGLEGGAFAWTAKQG